MLRQGCCSLSADESGRILDRLAGLEQGIPPEAVRQAIAATGRVNGRPSPLSHEVTLWVVLAMGVLTDLPIRQVFKHARRWRPDEVSPGRSALCQARQRLGIEPIRHLFGQVVRPLATPASVPTAFYRGWRLMAIDGTILDVPDTPANALFGRFSGGVARGDGAFPQVRKVSLVEVGTHVEVAFAWAGVRQAGEPRLVEALLEHVPADALLLGDRGFFSYDLWQKLDSRDIKRLIRVSRAPLLSPIRSLGDGSYLAHMYPRSHDRQRERHGVIVRVIRYTLDDPQRVGHGEVHRLVTNLLDAELYPAAELIPLYHQRWEQELTWDEQKTHLDPRRTSKPTHLRSQTSAGVAQELYALSLGHFVVRALMTEAAAAAGVDPDRLSFTGCWHLLRCRLPECDGRTPDAWSRWWHGLLAEMAREQIEPRRHRLNPRVIKRKMSKWPKKRPHHRPSTPLTKHFADTVVMLC